MNIEETNNHQEKNNNNMKYKHKKNDNNMNMNMNMKPLSKESRGGRSKRTKRNLSMPSRPFAFGAISSSPCKMYPKTPTKSSTRAKARVMELGSASVPQGKKKKKKKMMMNNVGEVRKNKGEEEVDLGKCQKISFASGRSKANKDGGNNEGMLHINNFSFMGIMEKKKEKTWTPKGLSNRKKRNNTKLSRRKISRKNNNNNNNGGGSGDDYSYFLDPEKFDLFNEKERFESMEMYKGLKCSDTYYSIKKQFFDEHVRKNFGKKKQAKITFKIEERKIKNININKITTNGSYSTSTNNNKSTRKKTKNSTRAAKRKVVWSKKSTINNTNNTKKKKKGKR